MANPYLSGRIPPELMEKVEQRVRETGESKTDIIVNAVSAYLGFPTELRKTQNSDVWDAIAEIRERLSNLENLTIQTEEIFKPLLSDSLQGDNNGLEINNTKESKTEEIVITDVVEVDSRQANHSNSSQTLSDNTKNRPDNKTEELPSEIIGPFNELNAAKYFGIDRNNLKYHRTKLEKAGKPLDTPKRVLHEGKSYDLICKGKTEGKSSIMWIAKPAKSAKSSENTQETPLFKLSSTKP